MALEHALLVSLREKPAAGLELARRFEASIGFFWSATHQQIYKVLHRMAADGWIEGLDTPRSARHSISGSPTKTYQVTDLGEKVLADWIAEPTTTDALRSTLAVKMRGASYGDRALLLADIKVRIAEHQARLVLYETLERRDYPEPTALSGQDLDQYLVLRGGILAEQFWTQWLTEYLEAHRS
ncbi:MAG TPA: PadR family transcriptional regulator [Marmoricola sp.]|nr:PadR family transcriptional regulator [Marmoricola sp.]